MLFEPRRTDPPFQLSNEALPQRALACRTLVHGDPRLAVFNEAVQLIVRRSAIDYEGGDYIRLLSGQLGPDPGGSLELLGTPEQPHGYAVLTPYHSLEQFARGVRDDGVLTMAAHYWDPSGIADAVNSAQALRRFSGFGAYSGYLPLVHLDFIETFERRQGLGSALLRHIKTLPCELIAAEPLTPAAQAFLVENGFIETGLQWNDLMPVMAWVRPLPFWSARQR